MDLATAVLQGNRLALARLLTQVENDTAQGRAALSYLYPHTGRAHLIGITGAPGTGKSSLVNHLARYFRQPPSGKAPQRVGIVAVDPSSPFSGGAILGDRVRMRDLAGDPGVFIRSMASRGALGGLATTTAHVVLALDAAGFEVILIETVGAGQAEVDIARLAHTTLVVEAPGLGDEIQAIKAGILEIADVLVVNKADLPGVEATERALRNMLQLANSTHPARAAARWQPPVLRTVATEGIGIAEVYAEIMRHRLHLEQSGEWQRRERARLQSELDSLLQAALVSRWRAGVPQEKYLEVVEKLVQRRLSPWEAVDLLLNNRGIKEVQAQARQ
jgi:LAO/AO transport system kinase